MKIYQNHLKSIQINKNQQKSKSSKIVQNQLKSTKITQNRNKNYPGGLESSPCVMEKLPWGALALPMCHGKITPGGSRAPLVPWTNYPGKFVKIMKIRKLRENLENLENHENLETMKILNIMKIRTIPIKF